MKKTYKAQFFAETRIRKSEHVYTHAWLVSWVYLDSKAYKSEFGFSATKKGAEKKMNQLLNILKANAEYKPEIYSTIDLKSELVEVSEL